MAYYNSNIQAWVLESTEVTFTLQAGTINHGINGNALNNILVGNDGNNIIFGGGGDDTLKGGAGNDTYYINSISSIVENENEGIDTVQIAFGDNNLTIDNYILPSNIERAYIYTDKVLKVTGNNFDNGFLVPGNVRPNLIIDGGLGKDSITIATTAPVTVLVDDKDDNIYIANNLPDTHVTVQALISYALSSEYIYSLMLAGTGNINGTGNEWSNTITGNEGANVLKGAGGDDTIYGGAGDDILWAGTGNNVLEGGTGADTIDGSEGWVVASYAHAAAAVRVNLSIVDGSDNLGEAEGDHYIGIKGTSGSAFHDILIGHGEFNWIDGGDGNDTLDGGLAGDSLFGGAGHDRLIGGEGADTMAGGSGDDIYDLDDAGDQVIEAAAGGFDTVIVRTDFNLGTLSHIEGAQLAEGSAGRNLTGSLGNERLVGNSAANVLDGGSGADTLEGGAGDDTYLIDNGADRIVEAANGGTDTAIVTVDFSLAAMANVEILKLADGTVANRLTGGVGNDRLVGNGGFNILDGGTGIDTLEGGAGSDVFIVDNAADRVIEAAGGGADAIQTSVSYALSADAEIEYLSCAGSGAIGLTGNAFANKLTGNQSANLLSGALGNDQLSGGLGNDVLSGGAGRDIFVFDTKASKKTNFDRVVDFKVKDDTFWLDNKVFTKLGKGTSEKPMKLASKAFFVGAKAHDANDRVIYDKVKGVLFYDSDGTGKAAAVQIAKVGTKHKMTNADIYVI